MLNLIDPTTWALWVFLPALRYILLPILIDWHIKSYIVLIPAFALICIGLQFGYATDNVYDALLGGLALIILLSLDLIRTYNQLCHANSTLVEAEQKIIISDIILAGRHS
jgi:hypothetical protein